MGIYVDILQNGTNSHGVTVDDFNAFSTDFIADGVVGLITNTSGIAPTTGAFSINAQGTPDMTVAVGSGVAYVTGTPTSGVSQSLRVKNDASANVTIADNATGGTRYDWLYIKLDADKMKDPAVDSSDVATLVTSRSTSSSTDNGTPPTYGYNLAVITVANGATSIANANISDKRTSCLLGSGIIGYAESTSNQTGITTEADLTSLSAVVNVPSGGKKVRITANTNPNSSVAGDRVLIHIKESTTQLQESRITLSGVTVDNLTSSVIITPTAGTHTYKATMARAGGTGTIVNNASSTNPSFISVEVI